MNIKMSLTASRLNAGVIQSNGGDSVALGIVSIPPHNRLQPRRSPTDLAPNFARETTRR